MATVSSSSAAPHPPPPLPASSSNAIPSSATVFVTATKSWCTVSVSSAASCFELKQALAQKQGVLPDQVCLRTVSQHSLPSNNESVAIVSLGTQLAVNILPLDCAVEFAWITPEIFEHRVAEQCASPETYNASQDYADLLPPRWRHHFHREVRVEDLKNWLLQAHGVLLGSTTTRQALELSLVKVGRDGTVHRASLLSTQRVFPYDDVVSSATTTVVRMEVRVMSEEELSKSAGPIQVSVRTLSGATFTLDVCGSSKIDQVKCEIGKRTGIPVNQQRLVYSLVLLRDDDELMDYRVHHRSVLHLITRIGGSIKKLRRFLEECPTTGDTQYYSLSESGLDWRACYPGCTVEGVCTSEDGGSCPAKGRKVIVNCFTGIVSSCDRFRCPMCHSDVIPLTYGFNRCTWRLSGLRRTSDGLFRTISHSTRAVMDTYAALDTKSLQRMATTNTFNSPVGVLDDADIGDDGDTSSSLNAAWSQFRIFTEPLGCDMYKCSICLDGISNECVHISTTTRRVLSCGHAFHTVCAHAWLLHDSYCPTCRQPIPPVHVKHDNGDDSTSLAVTTPIQKIHNTRKRKSV